MSNRAAKVLGGSLGLLFGCLLVSCNNPAPNTAGTGMTQEASSTPTEPVYRSPEGLQVASLPEVKPEKLAALLDVKEWDLDVTTPRASMPFMCYLETHQRGKSIASWGIGLGPSKDTHFRITILMAPLGENLNKAQKVKLIVQIANLNSALDTVGVTSTTIVDNPFHDAQMSMSG